MVVTAVAALGALLAVAWVLAPVARRRGYALPQSFDVEREGLQERQDMAFAALSELDADLELGKLSEEDYTRLYDRHRKQAVAALKAANEREAALTARVEEEVRRARRSGARDFVVAEAPPRRRLLRGPRPERRRAMWWSASAASIFLLFASVTFAYYVQRSRDAGASRPVATIAAQEPHALLLDASGGEWALAADASGVLRSGDGGASWSGAPVLPGDARGLARDARTPTRAYALVDGALHRSEDGGENWRRAGNGGAPPRLEALASDPAVGGRLFALDPAGALYASEDGGESWRAAGWKATGGEVRGLTVASSEPLVLFAATGPGVLRGEGGGWTDASGVLSGRLPEGGVSSVAFDPSTGEQTVQPAGESGLVGTLYAATDQGVYRSVDSGESWFGLGPQAAMRAVAYGPPDSRLLLAIGSGGEVYRSRNRGITWDGR